MRVLICPDRIGPLSSLQVGHALAMGWPDADSSVVPVGESGFGFVEAFADAFGGQLAAAADESGVSTVAVTAAAGDPERPADDQPTYAAACWEPATISTEELPVDETSVPLGLAVRRALDAQPRTLYVDLSGPVVHDAGAGLLQALGAIGDAPLDRGAQSLAALTRLDISDVVDALSGTDLVGVVPQADLDARLLGLRGITARRGSHTDIDRARLLAIDATLEQFGSLVDPVAAAAAGSGACGGLGFAILALGGRLATGPSVTLDTIERSRRPDLVVTGCRAFDFATRGGGVVAEVAQLAGELLAPCIVLAGELYVGAREMRAMGIEAAYAVRTGTAWRETAACTRARDEGAGRRTGRDESARGGGAADGQAWIPALDELTVLARRVARSWRW